MGDVSLHSSPFHKIGLIIFGLGAVLVGGILATTPAPSFVTQPANAQSSASFSGYTWSDNVGWITFDPSQ